MTLDINETNFKDECLWWILLVVVFVSFVGFQFVIYKVYVFVLRRGSGPDRRP